MDAVQDPCCRGYVSPISATTAKWRSSGMMNGIGWGMDGGGWIWMILGVVLVVALIWFFGSVRRGRDQSPTEDAAETLRSRFARGEISAEEYENARRVLGIK